MKQYLFLFPITGYVESAIRLTESIYERNFGKRDFPVYIDKIIETRYRNKGYEISWVFHRKHPDNYTVPYLGETSERLYVRDEDRKISSGTRGALVNPYYVLNRLPKHNKLILGGFHQFACVNDVAKVSYMRGVDTFVDEDTSDLYFVRIALLGEVPIERPDPIEGGDWNLEILDEYPGKYEDGCLVTDKIYRKGRPWFVQPD